MGLFGRKNEFSGRPTADDESTINRSPNTLHKRGGSVPAASAINPATTTTAAQDPYYEQEQQQHAGPGYDSPTHTNGPSTVASTTHDTAGRKKSRGGLFGRRRRSTSAGTSSSDEANHQRQMGGRDERVAGTTGLGATGAGVAAGGHTHGNSTTYGGTYGGYGNDADQMNLARTKVHAAEAAERDALRMLGVARAAVKEAHEHVDRLGMQADEDARRAGLRQKEAQSLRNDTAHLGQQF